MTRARLDSTHHIRAAAAAAAVPWAAASSSAFNEMPAVATLCISAANPEAVVKLPPTVSAPRKQPRLQIGSAAVMTANAELCPPTAHCQVATACPVPEHVHLLARVAPLINGIWRTES